MNDEKKKVMILGCLFAGVITIGAVQFMGKKKGPPPVPSPTTASAKTSAPAASSTPSTSSTDAATTPNSASATTVALKNPEVATPLPQRDPFTPPADAVTTAITPNTPKPTAMPASLDKPAPFPHSRLRGSLAGNVEPLPLPGSLTPMKGRIGGASPVSQGPAYTVVGVIQGAKPMAVVDDGSGNQKLVAVGSSIDGDTRLIGVDSTSVSVVSRGKVRRMFMGGNPVGK